MIILLISSVVFGTGEGRRGMNLGFIMFMVILLLMLGLFIWGLIYNFFIKKIAVKDDFYCLTNKRAFKYETKKDKLVYGYLKNYSDIHVNSKKDGYGMYIWE